MDTSSPSQNEFTIQIELKGLIRLLAQHLYAEADVFIRELIQNAHDSIVKRQQLDENAPPDSIWIQVDFAGGTIIIRDNGSGMTEEEVHKYLSRIGASGTRDLKEQLQSRNLMAAERLIGQFGIGLLSAFIVARCVTIRTRSYLPQAPGLIWESMGSETYSLRTCNYPEIGTEVTLYIDDQHRDMLQTERIRKAIKKYADFIGNPIFLNDEESSTNVIDAPWHKLFQNERDRLLDYYVFVQLRYPDSPLEIIPIHIEEPYKVDGVLYITDRHVPSLDVTGTVDIYTSRMFITSDNRDLLPIWAKFVRGVIDSPHLTPTAARDAVQQDEVFIHVKQALGKSIIEHLRVLASQNPEKFRIIMSWHHYHIKGMALIQDDFFQEIADFVPFETNTELIDLHTYIKKTSVLGSKESRIFYFNEAGRATQYYILCNAKGLLVINASRTFEEEFLRKYAKLKGVKLYPIDIAGSELIFEPVPSEFINRLQRLEMEYSYLFPDLRCIARVSNFKPDGIPAVITISKDKELRRDLELAQNNLTLPDSVRNLIKRVVEERATEPLTLHLNANNRIIQRLADMEPSPMTRMALVTLYNNSLLLAQHLISPSQTEIMFANFTDVLDALIENTGELENARRRLATLEISQKEQSRDQESKLSGHVSGFVAMPFDDHDFLLQALRELFETKPFFWEIMRADKKVLEEGILENIQSQMSQAHFYIAEVSEANPNVMLELGMMQAFSRPTVLLVHESITRKVIADLRGKIYLSYNRPQDSIPNSTFIEQLRTEFAKVEDLEKLKGTSHYLSPLILRHQDVSVTSVEKITRRYKTIEEFLSAKPMMISAETGVSEMAIHILRDQIIKMGPFA